jgi:hypothetical protein
MRIHEPPAAECRQVARLGGERMNGGYSGTPQAKKLGLKPGYRLSIDNAPAGWALTEAPDELVLVVAGAGRRHRQLLSINGRTG